MPKAKKVNVAAVRIENRAQLIYLLTEAAEIEHNVLCCYLFAQFSMKDDVSEGLTAEQLKKVRSWRTTIADIVVQEMLHLASACNLLTAVGGSPQLRRPNLPTSPRAYPDAFELRLVPFSLEALDQFVFLERPEYIGAGTRPAPGYRESSLAVTSLRDVFSRERDYETLGELYRGIEDGLDYLAQKLGENLFIGRPADQTAESFSTWTASYLSMTLIRHLWHLRSSSTRVKAPVSMPRILITGASPECAMSTGIS